MCVCFAHKLIVLVISLISELKWHVTTTGNNVVARMEQWLEVSRS